MSGMVTSNQTSARVTLSLTQNYLNDISKYKAGIGASTSRIETFISNLKNINTEYESAFAQIMDADIAEESTSLVTNQILQNSSVAVLAKANLQTQIVLELLRA
jgi:flagellin